MKKRQPRTLLEYAVAKKGFRRGSAIASFISCWGIAREMWAVDHPGDVFTVEDYAAWWKISRATAFREQAAFRECFPGETTPDRFIDIALAQRTDVAKLSPRFV